MTAAARSTVGLLSIVLSSAGAAHVARAQDAAPSAPSNPAAADERPTPSEPRPSPALVPEVHVGRRRTVLVHVDADENVLLEASTPRASAWSVVCSAPCDRLLSLDFAYRLTAPHMQPSQDFGLMGMPGQRLVLSVGSPSRAAKRGGVGLIVVGGSMIGAGAVIFLLGASYHALCSWEASSCPSLTGFAVVASLTAAAGTAVVVGGVVLEIRSSEWHARMDVATGGTPSVRSVVDTAWLRTPIWREQAKEGATASSRPEIPLLSGSF